jgi:hypothetical protein
MRSGSVLNANSVNLAVSCWFLLCVYSHPHTFSPVILQHCFLPSVFRSLAILSALSQNKFSSVTTSNEYTCYMEQAAVLDVFVCCLRCTLLSFVFVRQLFREWINFVATHCVFPPPNIPLPSLVRIF